MTHHRTAAFSYTTHGILLTDTTGLIIDANPAACSLTALPRHRLLGQNLLALIEGETTLPPHLAMLAEQGISHARWQLGRNSARSTDVCAIDIGQGHYLHILQDITEHLAAQRALQAAHQSARLADEQKSRLLAIISHELRTPLNGLIGMAEVMRRARADHAPHLDRLLQAARSLGRIVDDLLDYSRLEAGRIALHNTSFNIRELLIECHALFEPEASAKGLRLVTHIGQSVPQQLCGDRLRLSQILRNLIGNAIKFTTRGRVRVVLKARRGHTPKVLLALRVSDTGLGIPRECQRHIFEPFCQADAATACQFGGSGLGLSITRLLVTAMGGRLNLHSTPGRGSAFCAWLPFSIGTTQPTNAPREPARYPDARVVVIEDEPVSRAVIDALLRQHGIAAHLADDAAAGLAHILAANPPPQLVLMDVRTPVMDGLTATRMLRARGIGTPVVALSAGATPTEIAAARQAGMNDFLPKPIDPERLAQVLERTLQSALPGINEHDALPRFLGDRSALLRARDLFISQHTDTLAQIENALAQGEVHTLAHHAHRLHGAAANLGAQRIATLAQRIEHHPDKLPQLRQAFRELSRDYLP